MNTMLLNAKSGHVSWLPMSNKLRVWIGIWGKVPSYSGLPHQSEQTPRNLGAGATKKSHSASLSNQSMVVEDQPPRLTNYA